MLTVADRIAHTESIVRDGPPETSTLEILELESAELYDRPTAILKSMEYGAYKKCIHNLKKIYIYICIYTYVYIYIYVCKYFLFWFFKSHILSTPGRR